MFSQVSLHNGYSELPKINRKLPNFRGSRVNSFELFGKQFELFVELFILFSNKFAELFGPWMVLKRSRPKLHPTAIVRAPILTCKALVDLHDKCQADSTVQVIIAASVGWDNHEIQGAKGRNVGRKGRRTERRKEDEEEGRPIYK